MDARTRKLADEHNPCNATAMRKASRRLSQMYDDAIAPCNLKGTQAAILVELQRVAKDPPTMNELACSLVMDRSSLGHNLKPLERDGLVALHESEEDRRRRHVVLTALGRAKLREFMPLWQKAQKRFYEVFGKTRSDRLRATLLDIAYDERLAALKQ
jgi:DNA-binding MarR family transcriptional regulator